MLKLSSEISRRLISSTKPRLPGTCRQLSETKTLFDAKSLGNSETTKTLPIMKWDKIYQMEEIAFLSIISKLKIYQGVASAICIPSAFIGETMNVAPDDITFAMISISMESPFLFGNWIYRSHISISFPFSYYDNVYAVVVQCIGEGYHRNYLRLSEE